MAIFPLLVDPAHYRPCMMDLLADEPKRRHWIAHFLAHTDTVCQHVREEYAGQPDLEPRIAAMRERMLANWRRLETEPAAFGRLDILLFDDLRQAELDRAGFPDPYLKIKQEENAKSLALLPQVLADLDRHADLPARLDCLVRGVFAGNLFDLGSMATIAMHQAGELDFVHWRDERLAPGKWTGINHIPEFTQWFAARTEHGRPVRHALVLVDNSGSDTILGILPLVHELLADVGSVTLAANEKAALNDMTAGELPGVLDRVAAFDGRLGDAWRSGRLRSVSTGNATPLIDLTKVSDTFAHYVADLPADPADVLLILVGMGRALESNWTARFKCPTLRLAVVKDRTVGESLGLKMFDCVCRFERP